MRCGGGVEGSVLECRVVCGGVWEGVWCCVVCGWEGCGGGRGLVLDGLVLDGLVLDGLVLDGPWCWMDHGVGWNCGGWCCVASTVVGGTLALAAMLSDAPWSALLSLGLASCASFCPQF